MQKITFKIALKKYLNLYRRYKNLKNKNKRYRRIIKKLRSGKNE